MGRGPMIHTAYEQMHGRMRIQVGESYLTPREYECVCMYIDGRSHGESLRELGMAPATLGNHIRRAKERLGARTTYQLIAMVARADASRERGRSSNREAVYSSSTPGAAPSRAL